MPTVIRLRFDFGDGRKFAVANVHANAPGRASERFCWTGSWADGHSVQKATSAVSVSEFR